MEDVKSCFFTGHSSFIFKHDRAAAKNLRLMISSLAESGVTDFYAGGDQGWDMFCEWSVLQLKNDYPQVKLHLVLPCSPEKQTLNWDIEKKIPYDVIFDHADSIYIMSENYTKDCMKKRNARLVELGDICICYFNEKNSLSCTGQTIHMAQKASRTVINMYSGH